MKSQECITARHLFERTIAACARAVRDTQDGTNNVDGLGRCENISALVTQLQLLLKRGHKFVLVLDGIDRQRETSPTLLPALARLGEIVCDVGSYVDTELMLLLDARSHSRPHCHRSSATLPPYDWSAPCTLPSLRPSTIIGHRGTISPLYISTIRVRQ